MTEKEKDFWSAAGLIIPLGGIVLLILRMLGVVH